MSEDGRRLRLEPLASDPSNTPCSGRKREKQACSASLHWPKDAIRSGALSSIIAFSVLRGQKPVVEDRVRAQHYY